MYFLPSGRVTPTIKYSKGALKNFIFHEKIECVVAENFYCAFIANCRLIVISVRYFIILK